MEESNNYNNYFDFIAHYYKKSMKRFPDKGHVIRKKDRLFCIIISYFIVIAVIFICVFSKYHIILKILFLLLAFIALIFGLDATHFSLSFYLYLYILSKSKGLKKIIIDSYIEQKDKIGIKGIKYDPIFHSKRIVFNIINNSKFKVRKVKINGKKTDVKIYGMDKLVITQNKIKYKKEVCHFVYSDREDLRKKIYNLLKK